MAEQKKVSVFRKKTLDRISSPEQLTDYLRVTNPGIWVILAAVIVLLAGIFVWSMVGTLETTAEARVIMENHIAQVVPAGAESLNAGMTLRVAGQETVILSAETDEFGRPFGMAEVNLPDGAYDGVVVTEAVHPIQFLLTSR
ncbi:MAG: hypothetical protein IKH30_03990 [Clostridia bacterium]|jgi:hypothetical protein|nr:hypothetical protein [Clostridia bacterium]MBR3742771.1 hypothetical protein [Clostridia bacterium]MBR4331377.1 hypothetical protein [Clostridia bacterium]MBR4359940.1 hypothetical protein [Clostridia bacterium]MBR4537501.1 hypothetical protein [Clostridia bacterium]